MSNYDFVRAYDEEYAQWLDERGHPRPAVREGNRLPAPAEILAVLAEIPDSELDIDGRYVDLRPEGSGPNDPYWLTLAAPARCSWDDETWDASGYFTVRGYWEKELIVVIALTPRCGQLLIYPDTGAVAVILDSHDDPSTVTRLLNEAANEPDEWQAFHRLRYG